MIAIYIFLFSTLYAALFALRNYWQIRGYVIVEPIAKAKWHNFQFGLQITVAIAIIGVMIALDYSWLKSIAGGFLFGATFWIVFEAILHHKLEIKFFYADNNGFGKAYKRIAWLIIRQVNRYRGDRGKRAVAWTETYVGGVLIWVSKVAVFGLSLLLIS
jgi:hypothetical protein